MSELSFKQNPHFSLNDIVRDDKISWVSQNTALLVVHGIGDQLPMQTLDQFGRGLVKAYRKAGINVKLNHILATRGEGGDVWYDNVLRITMEGDDKNLHIDLYEYYWANYTQDKASWKSINTWLQGVVKGADSFYKRNALLGKQYKDQSPFFDTRTGEFKTSRYRLFMGVASKLFFLWDVIYKGLLGFLSGLPLLGKFAASSLESYTGTLVHKITNIIGDVVVYNVVDPKSQFYDVRRKILDGAVKAIKYLIEKPERTDLDINSITDKPKYDACKSKQLPRQSKECKESLKKEKLAYPSVIIAGHSLGSQVAYDAINKINLLVNKGDIRTYNGTHTCSHKGACQHLDTCSNEGICLINNNIRISEQLNGFITFGSPLDKIIFFLRENVPDNEFLRQQILDHYHGFKQRDIDEQFNNERTNKDFVRVNTPICKLLEKVQWRNYFDNKDYVSGGLDYYTGLTNVDCEFKTGKFTHSNYWEHNKFYVDIIRNFLN